MKNDETISNFAEEKEDSKENIEEYAYKNVIGKKGNTRIFSLVSVVCAALSVIFSFVPWLGLVLGLVAIGFSLVSRKELGYFEGLAIVGLIVGIFGFVFSLTGIILGVAIENSEYSNFWSLLFGGFLI